MEEYAQGLDKPKYLARDSVKTAHLDRVHGLRLRVKNGGKEPQESLINHTAATTL